MKIDNASIILKFYKNVMVLVIGSVLKIKELLSYPRIFLKHMGHNFDNLPVILLYIEPR